MLGISTTAQNKYISEDSLNKLTPTYYVDATNGSDSNSGGTKEFAWKTIAKVSSERNNFNGGDVIAFNRGDSWKEHNDLYLSVISGDTDNPIRFTSYGSGAKPEISVLSAQTSYTWVNVSGSTWYSSGVTINPRRLLIDGTERLRTASSEHSELGTNVPDLVEWFWGDNGTDGVGLYIYSSDSPENHIVTFTQQQRVLSLALSRYLHFSNLAFVGGYSQSVVLQGSSDITFDNCEFGKWASNGVSIDRYTPDVINYTKSTNIVVKNSLFDSHFRFDYSTAGTSNEDSERGCNDGILIYSCDVGEVSGNVFKNWGHSSISLYAALSAFTYTGQQPEMYVTEVKIHDNYCTAPDISYGGRVGQDGNVYNCEWYSNTIENVITSTQLAGFNNHFHHNIWNIVRRTALTPNDDAYGISLSNYAGRCDNNIYEHNVIINCDDHGIRIAGDYDTFKLSGNTFQNNILYNCGLLNGGISLIAVLGGSYPNQNDGNIIINNSIYSSITGDTISYYGTVSDVATFNANTGDTHGYTISANIAGDPQFVDPESDWKLQASSPAINRGFSGTSATIDYYGNTIPFDNSPPDIGIHELHFEKANNYIYEPQAGGKVVYLDIMAADDTGDGTEGNPYKDIELTLIPATTRLSSGDVLVMRGGTYPTTVMLSLPVTRNTEAERIVVQSYPYERAIIDATNIVFQQPENAGYLEGVLSLYNGRNYDIVDSIEIHNSAKIGIYLNNQYSSILNCKTYHTGASGIYVGAAGYATIDNNEIELGTYLGDQEMLTVYGGSHDCVISNNHVHHGGWENAHGNGLGIDLKDGCYNIEVYGNTVNDIRSHGIYIDSRGDTNNIQIYNNTVYNISPIGNGIQLATEAWLSGDSICNNVQIYNNVLYDITGHGIRLGYSSEDFNYYYDIHIVNNSIYNIKYVGILYFLDSDTGHTANNIYISNNAMKLTGWVSPTTWSPIQREVGSNPAVVVNTNTNIIDRDQGDKGTNAIVTDPTYVDEANGDLRLYDSSVGIDAGYENVNVYYPTTDHGGTRRPINSVIDIGAYEGGVVDNVSPTLISSTVVIATPTNINMVFDKPVYMTNLVSNGFTLSGTTSTSFDSISGSGINWTGVLNTEVTSGDTVLLSYNSATGDIVDGSSNILTSFTNILVTNNLDDPYGDELVQNGDFSNGLTDWVSGATGTPSTLSVVSGELQVDMNDAYTGASQILELEIGETYQIYVDARRLTATGDYSIGINGDGWEILNNYTNDTMTTHDYQFTPTQTEMTVYLFGSQANVGTNVFDNVSVRKLL